MDKRRAKMHRERAYKHIAVIQVIEDTDLPQCGGSTD